MGTQTETFHDLEVVDPYISLKTGIDASTQMDASDSLFDYEVEVQPIVDVLVSKTFEQAVLELEQEWEHCVLSKTLETLHAKTRENELEIKKQENEAWTMAKKCESEKREMVQVQMKQHRLTKKVAAAQAGQALVKHIQEIAFTELQNSGFFQDPLANQIKDEFLPFLYTRIDAYVMSVQTCQALVVGMF